MSKTRSFQIFVTPDEQGDRGEVAIGTEVGRPEPEFGYWMMACEYLMHVVAQKSNAGYERAMELLMKGAMTYEHKELPGPGRNGHG